MSVQKTQLFSFNASTKPMGKSEPPKENKAMFGFNPKNMNSDLDLGKSGKSLLLDLYS